MNAQQQEREINHVVDNLIRNYQENGTSPYKRWYSRKVAFNIIDDFTGDDFFLADHMKGKYDLKTGHDKGEGREPTEERKGLLERILLYSWKCTLKAGYQPSYHRTIFDIHRMRGERQ